MANVKLRLRYGDAELEFEGDHAQLAPIADTWWERLTSKAGPYTGGERHADRGGGSDVSDPGEGKEARRKPRVKSRTSSQDSGAPVSEGGFDVNDLANAIKADPSYKTYEKKVLHNAGKGSLFDKIAFICSQAGKPLTSGEIQRTLRALMVKVDPANVSKTLAKNSSSFFTSKVRSAGGQPPRYELTGPANTAFEQRMSA